MIGLLDLPTELVEDILERVGERFRTATSGPHLEVKDTKKNLAALSSLSLTCKVLYYRLTLRVYCYMTKEDGPSHDAFLATIRSSKGLAKLVKCYYTPKTMHESGLWQKIISTIPLMPNLKVLAFRYNPLLPPSNLFPAMPKKGPMPFRLHCLLMEHIDFQHNDEACNFVITQQELKHLLWPINENIEPQVAARFPKTLITLEAPCHPISELLQGRSIQNLGFMTNSHICPPLPLPLDEDSREFKQRPNFLALFLTCIFPQEFRSVRSISFITSGYNGDCVIEFFRFLATRGSLGRAFSFIWPHTVGTFSALEDIVTDSTNIQLIHTMLASDVFPNIKHVKMAWDTNEPDGFNRVQGTVLDIFMLHQKIRIFVIFGKDDNDPQYCREWRRDNEDSPVELL